MIQPEKIIIADDHPLFRQALLGTLKAKLTYTTWLEAQTIEELELEQPVLILHLYKLYHTLQLGVRR